MTDEALMTLRQLSTELKLPESTIRYYRDAFIEHIPSVGTGRRRRYPPDAVAVLRSIADGYSSGRTRSQIVAAIHGTPATHLVSVDADRAVRSGSSVDEVSNLDLLAAIVDGEREQRDALWQMAKEIVRLTQVLDGQDKVLTEIADRAGVMVGPERRLSPVAAPVAALAAAPEPTAATPATAEAAPARPAEPAPYVAPPSPPSPVPSPPSFGDRDGAAMERLRAELESERALVEKLRESKLTLEHRAANAEAALEEQRPRRDSMIKRLLGGSDK